MSGESLRLRPANDAPAMLVDIAPNGVTGSWSAVHRVAAEHQPVLSVVDHIFALPTYQDSSEFLTTLRGRLPDLARTVVLFTPSKDLSIPGLRCGAFITKNSELLEHARADRFERGYSVHAATARVAAAHLATLWHAFPKAGPEPDRLDELFAAAGLRWLSAYGREQLEEHLAASHRLFRHNADLLGEAPFLAPAPGAGEPAAGYSTLLRLDGPFRSPDQFTRWIRQTGRAGLKLNPTYLFGAHPRTWSLLYPGLFAVRGNVSVPSAELSAALELLGHLLEK
jgi:hypothetical protein